MVAISQITKELRVPELKYEITNSEETKEVVDELCEFLFSIAKANLPNKSDTSLIKTLASHTKPFYLSPRIYNSLFLCDRLIGVFYRKANIHDQLKDALSGWRFAVARILILHPKLFEAEDSPVLALIDEICASQVGWTQEPKRISQAVMERLDQIHNALLSVNTDSPELLLSLKEEWLETQEKQHQRLSKLFERLLSTEKGVSNSRYANEYSHYILGRLIGNRILPGLIGDFISSTWQGVLRNAILKNGGAAEWMRLEKLTERFINVYSNVASTKHETLFAEAEGLVDELAAASEQNGVKVEHEFWETIQQLLISVLQGEEVRRTPVAIRASSIDFESNVYPTEDAIAQLTGSWYLLNDNVATTRVKFAKYFEDSRDILWINHAGMKSMIMPYLEFNKRIVEGSIKAIPPCYLLSQVFKETLKGLGKVAKAQQEARERAKEKAEAEAEQLRAEKKRTEELARQKELEAARLIQEQRLKLAEQRRLEQEREAMKVISELSLGAWISVSEKDNVQNYKLVVRINATDKLIFVDKMGLKKFEIKTPDLMARLISKDIKVLSDGAEFDDTLSRVVGRLRVGK